jgi:hypothetical protein
MVEIKLGNIGCEIQVQKIKAKLEGQTYMNFIVYSSRMQDNWPVSVATEHETVTKKELRKMVMYILALSL